MKPLKAIQRTEKRLKRFLKVPEVKVDYGKFEIKPRIDEARKILDKTNYSKKAKEKALQLLKSELKDQKRIFDIAKFDHYDPAINRITIYDQKPFTLAHELVHAARRKKALQKVRNMTGGIAELLQDMAFSSPQLALALRTIPLAYAAGVEAGDEILTNLKARKLPRMGGKTSKEIMKRSIISYVTPVLLWSTIAAAGPRIIATLAKKLGPRFKQFM